MKDIRETGVEHVAGDDYVTFFSSECKWINHIKRLKEKYPNQVDIQRVNQDGSMIAKLPVSWFQIKPRKTVNFTEEQIMAATARLEKGRLKRAGIDCGIDVHVVSQEGMQQNNGEYR